jgi:hypothetical protein
VTISFSVINAVEHFIDFEAKRLAEKVLACLRVAASAKAGGYPFEDVYFWEKKLDRAFGI